jgi:secondary thiamine-phosphate synthase enzyme
MKWIQQEMTLRPRARGFHVITREVEEALVELADIRVGMAHIHLLHTSASLTINENVSPDVRLDFESHFNQMVPENMPYYEHTLEGSDDMPAHIKGSLLDFSLSIPVRDGRFYLGTWQGIYLCEHRNHGGARRVVVTAWGE